MGRFWGSEFVARRRSSTLRLPTRHQEKVREEAKEDRAEGVIVQLELYSLNSYEYSPEIEARRV